MSPEILERLADFERRHKPDSRRHLANFREEIVALHFKGYSLKATFAYLMDGGVGCSLRTFERWVKDNIDFAQETPPMRATVSAQATAPAAATDGASREAALAMARERRENGFKNPVGRALEGRA